MARGHACCYRSRSQHTQKNGGASMFRRRKKEGGAVIDSPGAHQAIDSAAFFWIVGSLCQLLRIPFDAALVAQAFPPPHDTTSLQGVLGDLGIRSGLREASSAQLGTLPLPLVAFRRVASAAPAPQPTLAPAPSTAVVPSTAGPAPDTPAAATAPATSATPAITPLLILAADATRLLVIGPGDTGPRAMARPPWPAAKPRSSTCSTCGPALTPSPQARSRVP